MDLLKYGLVALEDGYNDMLIKMVTSKNNFRFYDINSKQIDSILEKYPLLTDKLYLSTGMSPLVILDIDQAIVFEIENIMFMDQYIEKLNYFQENYKIDGENFSIDWVVFQTENKFLNLIKEILLSSLTFSKKDKRKLAIQCYIHLEYNHKMEELTSILKETGDFKSEGEIKGLSSLPENVQVYRGQTSQSTDLEDAVSWTTDRNKAVWFANRFDSDGDLYSAFIKKENILSFIDDRSESEVIVEFKSLTNLKKEGK